MPARTGDIYSAFSEKLNQYVACQVTALKNDTSRRGGQLAALLDLDWSGDALPDAAALASMRLLVCNYYFWNDRIDQSYVSANVPANCTLVGNIAPLSTQPVNSYGGGWNSGDNLWRQRRWDQIDPAQRQRFKAARADVEVVVGGQVLRQNTTSIDDDVLQTISDWSELERLPCLTSIETRHGTQELADFIHRNPFIDDLKWASATVTALDFRHSRLNRLIIDPDRLHSLHLNDDLEYLIFNSAPAAGLQIHHGRDGRGLTLQCTAAVAPFHGLDALGGLLLINVNEVDLEAVVQRFSALTQLRIWGKPGIAINLPAIAKLPHLRIFTACDLFGYAAHDFPSPSQLPHLSMLWLISLPADVAKAVKKAFRPAAAAGLDLSITSPRKPEWLAENLHNPFRDWDGRQHIPAIYAKKAAQIYKQLLAATRAIEATMDAHEVQLALAAMVTDYTDAFNQIDRRSSIIETVEREEIYTVLLQWLRQLQQPGQLHRSFDEAALLELFDRLREF